MKSSLKFEDSVDERLRDNFMDLSFEFGILSFNKANHTRSLIQSIYKFEKDLKFKILILDQASHLPERLILEKLLIDYSEVKLIDSGRNLGVGGGRNLLLENATADWLVFLDNDLELNGSILNQLLKSKSQGNFFSLPFEESSIELSEATIPYLYLEGEAWSESANAGLGGVSFSDFKKGFFDRRNVGVAGGVFAAKTKVLREVEGYKSPGLVGYEDLELTLRLKNLGHAISVLDIEPLTHNKLFGNSGDDSASEIQRLNLFELRANAIHIEKKHGYRVWGNNQYDWLVNRAINASIQQEMIKNLNPYTTMINIADKRPFILLVCDVPGWAFHNIALKYKELFSHLYNFEIVYSVNWAEFCVTLFRGKWDAVIFLWRVPLFQLFKEGSYPTKLLSRTGFHVCDYQGSMGYENEVKSLVELGVKSAYVNEDLYSAKHQEEPNSFYLPDGVDTNVFRPRAKGPKRTGATVGWVGNRLWGGIDDVKGYSKVIKPTLEYLESNQLNVTFEVIDASAGAIPKHAVASRMREWSAVICTSKHEGTPNPVLEGLSSGLKIISTRVGMLPEIEKSGGVIGFIDQSHRDLIQEIKKVAEMTYQERLEIDAKNRKVAMKWDWKNVAPMYLNFIQGLVGGSK
jgi:glycosyltransferase involved in cell wall biosynthesis